METKKVHPFFPDWAIPFVERTKVEEVVPDVWYIEGFPGTSFFVVPPSSNVYILRDGDLVVMVDSGTYPHYRDKILRILRKYSRDGASTLVLLNTQGHWDHAMNNDVVLEAGFENIRFLVPEPEIPVYDMYQDFGADLRKLEGYFEPFQEWLEAVKEFHENAKTFPEYREPKYDTFRNSVEDMNPENVRHRGMSVFKHMVKTMYPRLSMQTMEEFAEVLPLRSREKRMYGNTEVMGWQVGRFFIIHDGSHSPGHISLYDPKDKVAVVGDVTIEINPVTLYTDFGKCVQAARRFRVMAEEGFIEYAMDGHRTAQGFTQAFQLLGIEPFHPIELVDVARGIDECSTFFRAFEDMYSEEITEVVEAHKAAGEATVQEIADRLFTSSSRIIKLRKGFPFPNRKLTLIANVLKETGATGRICDGKILFTPAPRWAF